MGFLSRLANSARSAREKSMLYLIFQDNDWFRKQALQTFEKIANDRGLEVDDNMISVAKTHLATEPDLTMGEFLDIYSIIYADKHEELTGKI